MRTANISGAETVCVVTMMFSPISQCWAHRTRCLRKTIPWRTGVFEVYRFLICISLLVFNIHLHEDVSQRRGWSHFIFCQCEFISCNIYRATCMCPKQ